ncbi:uncharacterized protein [Rutidosis leptorrhynchoides]|uniref:uncharacterized protein n=1 Tax=Rutidosis leptorrhynchoides TaxID=125765 RepID=UPI003A9951D2
MGWNPLVVNVIVIDMSDQVVHCLIHFVREDKRTYVSIVYAKNYYIHRRDLWDNLCKHTIFVGNHPWVIMGFFNVSLNLEDSTAGGSNVTLAMREFQECVDHMRMSDVSQSGLHFTWNQRPNASEGILKKIDRIMANDIFINEFLNAHAVFLSYRIYDHSPAVLKIPTLYNSNIKSFKFLISLFIKRLRLELDQAQIWLDSDPFSNDAREEHCHLLHAYNSAVIDEERFLQQKSKIEWLHVGDNNTSFFHKVVKGKQHRNHILTVEDNMGNIVEGRDVPACFVSHFTNFLGNSSNSTPIDIPVLAAKIKSAIFDIGNNKSLGPDGYTTEFFMSTWNIIGDDIVRVVQDFFSKPITD